MFDFGFDIRNEGGVQGKNNKGLVTFDRKIKKDTYFFYQSMWSKAAMVHVCGRRFVDRHLEKIKVNVYSNQDEVKLTNMKQLLSIETIQCIPSWWFLIRE